MFALAAVVLVFGARRFSGLTGQAAQNGFCCLVRGNACVAKTLAECGALHGAFALDEETCNVVSCNYVPVGNPGGGGGGGGGGVCGNGVVDGNEQCENAAQCQGGNLCVGCQCRAPVVAHCGNGVVDAGEACEPGQGRCVLGNSCINCTCVPTPAVGCGNGRMEAGEQCDDGNQANGDGCTSTCVVQAQWQCSLPVPSGVCGFLYTFNDGTGRTTANQFGTPADMAFYGQIGMGPCAPSPYPSNPGCLTAVANPVGAIFTLPQSTIPADGAFTEAMTVKIDTAPMMHVNGLSYASCSDTYLNLFSHKKFALLMNSSRHVVVLGTGITSSITLDGNWHRLAYTWDGSIGKLYIDGVVNQTSPTPPNLSAAALQQVVPCFAALTVSMDDFLLYPDDLTAQQVQGLQNGLFPPFLGEGACPTP